MLEKICSVSIYMLGEHIYAHAAEHIYAHVA
jgi:hypothetical protein